MLHAVIFDFDGVLADSEPLHYEAFRRVLAREGRRPRAGRILREVSGLRRCRCVSRGAGGPRAGLDGDERIDALAYGPSSRCSRRCSMGATCSSLARPTASTRLARAFRSRLHPERFHTTSSSSSTAPAFAVRSPSSSAPTTPSAQQARSRALRARAGPAPGTRPRAREAWRGLAHGGHRGLAAGVSSRRGARA